MEAFEIPRHTRYRRRLEGADFSLEANTEAVPEAGHFYLLRAGQVLSRTDDFFRAEEGYLALCVEYWDSGLGSPDAGVRRMSALGLLGQNPGHSAATRVIREDGTAGDRARLEHARRAREARERREAVLQVRRAAKSG